MIILHRLNNYTGYGEIITAAMIFNYFFFMLVLS